MTKFAVPVIIAVIGSTLSHIWMPLDGASIWTHWSVVASLIFLSALLIIDCCRPINKKHEAREFGAGATQRIAGPTPPPYPNGWYVLYNSYHILDMPKLRFHLVANSRTHFQRAHMGHTSGCESR